MFDLITGKATHAPRNQTVPIVMSIGAHVIAIGAVLAVTVLVVGNPLPDPPRVIAAFIASPPPPPPPPPPPAPAPTRPRAQEQRPVATASNAAPIELPRSVEPEAAAVVPDDEEGVPGGVPGGIPGGVIAGIVGGEVAPPPPPAQRRAPTRVGGAIQPPALLRRVEPLYPPLAVAAQVQGLVILEAVVNEQGVVEDVRVLRSVKPLDQAAIEAVRQWVYSPLTLNGQPSPFVLTVTLQFSLD